MSRTFRAVRITAALAILGGIGGACAAIVLTAIGSLFSAQFGYAGEAVYRWHAGPLAVLGAIAAPAAAWLSLRRVPIWRAVAEPLIAGMAASVISTIVPSIVMGGLLPPVGVLAAIARLRYVHREHQQDSVDGQLVPS